jgi:hypothetical protein
VALNCEIFAFCTFLDVEGPVDINGNKKAGEQARDGSETNFCGPEPCLPLSLSVVRQNTKKFLAADSPNNGLERHG